MPIAPDLLPTHTESTGLIELVGISETCDVAPSFGGLLRQLHVALRQRARLGDIVRIAVATYDAPTDMLRTFASTDGTDTLLQRYQAPLASLPSLHAAATEHAMRNLPDLRAVGLRETPHTAMLTDAGYRASLAIPVQRGSQLLGFIFFDGAVPNLFTRAVRDQLWPYAHLIAVMLTNELELTRIVRGAAQTAQELARYKDPETGAHLQRMARFARLIATALAPQFKLTDEFIEYLFWFAPLHDIGKVAIPDSILLKPAQLTPSEYVAMQRHVQYGIEIADRMSGNFGLGGRPHIDLMRNVIACHHECVDGSGYPAGLKAAEIPIEGRITAVADVFDALTSIRPYKPRWDNDRALAFLRDNRGTRFDAACVDALADNLPAAVLVQDQFIDAPGI